MNRLGWGTVLVLLASACTAAPAPDDATSGNDASSSDVGLGVDAGLDAPSVVDVGLDAPSVDDVGVDASIPAAGCVPHDGTRLHMRSWVADGIHRFVAWHDTTLDVDCRFATAADGSLRCLPSGTVNEAGGIPYADAACTQLTVDVSSTSYACDTQYVSLEPAHDQVGCVAPTRVFATPTGADLTEVYRFDGSGACVGPDVASPSTRAVGAEVPASSFVLGTRMQMSAGSRLEEGTIAGEDGSFECTGDWFDPMLAEGCDAQPTATTTRACTPTAAQEAVLYADAACTMQVGTLDTTACNPSAFVGPTTGPAFCAPDALYRRGALHAGTTVYRSFGGTCTDVGASATTELHDLGALVPDSTLVHVARERGTETGRLRSNFDHADDGSRRAARSAPFYDTTLNVNCAPGISTDGSLRCIPAGLTIESGFSDAGCTTPLLLGNHYIDGCADLDIHYGRAFSAFACGAPLDTYELGAVTTAPFYRGAPGSCFMVAPTSSTERFAITRMIPSSELEPVTDLVE